MLLPSPTSLKRPRALHHRLSTILLLVFLLSKEHHLSNEFLRKRLIQWKLNRPLTSFIWSQFRFESGVRRWRRVKPNVLFVATKINQRFAERLERGHMVANGFARLWDQLVDNISHEDHPRPGWLLRLPNILIDTGAFRVFHGLYSHSSERTSEATSHQKRLRIILVAILTVVLIESLGNRANTPSFFSSDSKTSKTRSRINANLSDTFHLTLLSLKT